MARLRVRLLQLHRSIQREIETPLAKRLLAGGIKPGETVWIDVDAKDSGLAFRSEKTAEAAVVH